jgi:hypothetical protein
MLYGDAESNLSHQAQAVQHVQRLARIDKGLPWHERRFPSALLALARTKQDLEFSGLLSTPPALELRSLRIYKNVASCVTQQQREGATPRCKVYRRRSGKQPAPVNPIPVGSNRMYCSKKPGKPTRQ